MLNDITNGTNPGCGTEGFEAVEGWDPVTGLGECDLSLSSKPLGSWVVLGLLY